jgi:hypothetical protein
VSGFIRGLVELGLELLAVAPARGGCEQRIVVGHDEVQDALARAKPHRRHERLQRVDLEVDVDVDATEELGPGRVQRSERDVREHLDAVARDHEALAIQEHLLADQRAHKRSKTGIWGRG